MELTAVLTADEEGGYVASHPETGTTTQGETVEDAFANLQEATALYLAVFGTPSPDPTGPGRPQGGVPTEDRSARRLRPPPRRGAGQ